MTHSLDDYLPGSEPVTVPVRIVEAPASERSAPDFSSWNTLKLNGNENPQRLLPFNDKRDRAIISCDPGNIGNAAGSVLVGTQAQVSNGVGMRFYSGKTIEVQGRQEVWCMPDGVNSLYMSVLDERWR